MVFRALAFTRSRGGGFQQLPRDLANVNEIRNMLTTVVA